MKKEYIKTYQLKDGRWFSQYLSPFKIISGTGQFGSTAFEAQINLQVLLNSIDKEILKTNVIMRIES